jgi:hypothetical protein
MATHAHQLLDVLLYLVRRCTVLYRNLDEADVLIARDSTLKGPQRNQNEIVLIRAHGRLPLGLKNPDYLTRDLFHSDFTAQRVLSAEKLFAHSLTQNADRLAGTQLVAGKFTSAFYCPVPHFKVLAVDPGNFGGPVFIAEYRRDTLSRRRRHGTNGADVPGNGLGVIHIERRSGGSLAHAYPLTGGDYQQIAAQAGNLLAHLNSGATTESYHGDDCCYPDDDAKDGQRRTHEVAADFPQGQ